MSDPAAPPKVFISYSWSSDEHKQWVLDLATRLRNDGGVDVVLDRWRLKEGHDKYHFMEQMVTDPQVTKVLVVCDRKYAEKADKRTGGVGTETQIISDEVYRKVDQEKFIPIIRQRDEGGEPHVPTFLSARKYIDFTDDDNFEESYDLLIRNIHGRPELKEPEIGKPPAHIFVEGATVVKTAGKFRRFKDAVEKDKPNTQALLREYIESFIDALGEFRTTPEDIGKGEPGAVVLEKIGQMRPYRDECIELFVLYATRLDNDESYTQVHDLLEQLLQLRRPQDPTQGYSDWHFDHYCFFGHELSLYLIAALFHYRRFRTAARFIDDRYTFYWDGFKSKPMTVGFHGHEEYISSLEESRGRRRGDGGSVAASIIHSSVNHPRIKLRELFQADMTLFLRPVIVDPSAGTNWYPRLSGYSREQGVLDLFARADTAKGQVALRDLFGVKDAKELATRLWSAFQSKALKDFANSDRFFIHSISGLVNWEDLKHLVPNAGGRSP